MRRAGIGILAAVLAAMWPAPVCAWGALGHRIVAEDAALLVADDLPATWGPVLARHRFALAHYAFVPDSLFRSNDGAGGTIEAPTHYLDLDLLPGAATDRPPVPRDYTGARDRYEAQVGADTFRRAGSSPWRVAQLFDLARGRLARVKSVRGGYQSGARAEGDTRAIYEALEFLGLLAHYSGDASMPYHATSDSNAFSSGQGGLHFYFEGDCVNTFEPGLAAEVLAAARKNRARWLREWNAPLEQPAGLVLAVLRDSARTVPRLAELDAKHAVLTRAAAGSREPASRRPPSEGCRVMMPLLVERLAKGAVLTAALWRLALPEGVDFSGAEGFELSEFEMRPEYVAPTYTAAPRAP